MSRIILTDIHGCYKTMLALIDKLPPGIPLTFAGDLIDRGPDSKSVVEYVKANKHDCVLGNHEVMMVQELEFDPDGAYIRPSYMNGIWLMNGGDKCLDSYQNDNGDMDDITLRRHQRLMKTLPYYLEYPELKNDKGQHLLVTHTTAAHVWNDEEVSKDSPRFQDFVTWERDPFPAKIEGIYNVYGHTPQQYKATVKEHFACIDTGGYFKRENYGKLTALQFPEMIVYEQKNIE
jgi:serine/threonine protein phosphatase 1